MGLTYVAGVVRGPRGRKAPVRFLVDSGASYSLVPHAAWRAIGLKKQRTVTFTLADGTTVDRDVSECHLTLKQGQAHTPVILGEPGDAPLLGVVTLEILGLVLNPFERKLQPARMMLAPLRRRYGLRPTRASSAKRPAPWSATARNAAR